ncbi:cupredoxin domain-containing protein [Candidatus Peregrinibacteria bacterium]|nr:cupredoxin domain-containing protein [Candidatus Peregrinibacteria bacterium]
MKSLQKSFVFGSALLLLLSLSACNTPKSRTPNKSLEKKSTETPVPGNDKVAPEVKGTDTDTPQAKDAKNVPENKEKESDVKNIPAPEAKNTENVPVAKGNVKEFVMTAKKWKFIPSEITVEEGDTVRLSVTSLDVEHGLAIPQYGINKKVPAGETVDIEFVADKVGTFPFVCSVLCGEGHGNMKGQLTVVEKKATPQ